MDDVIAGRQHDVRGRPALLADQLERAGIVGLVGEHPPHQPAIDDRQILAEARRQRQHRLVRTWRAWCRCCGRRNRSDRRRHDGRLVQRRGKGRICAGAGGRRQIERGPARGLRNQPGRHRRRPVLEHLGKGLCRQQRERHGKRQRRERPAGPPVFPETIAPWSHGHAFHRKRGKFKPPMASSGRHDYGTGGNTDG